MADQSKPQWDIRIDSEHAIPRIIRNGESLHDSRHGLIDFVLRWHTNDERGINKTKWQALFVKVDIGTSMPDAFAYWFIEGTGNYAEMNIVPSTIETCAEAEKYRRGSAKSKELTMHLNLDCSDALKGLKAVQREARKAEQSLRQALSIPDVQQEKDKLYEAVNRYPITVNDAVNALNKYGKLKLAGFKNYDIEKSMDSIAVREVINHE